MLLEFTANAVIEHDLLDPKALAKSFAESLRRSSARCQLSHGLKYLAIWSFSPKRWIPCHTLVACSYDLSQNKVSYELMKWIAILKQSVVCNWHPCSKVQLLISREFQEVLCRLHGFVTLDEDVTWLWVSQGNGTVSQYLLGQVTETEIRTETYFGFLFGNPVEKEIM